MNQLHRPLDGPFFRPPARKNHDGWKVFAVLAGFGLAYLAFIFAVAVTVIYAVKVVW